MNYIVYNYENEDDDIPTGGADDVIVLDVGKLDFATTNFLHKLVNLKEKIIIANLHGQPMQAFVICGLESIIKAFKTLEEAKEWLGGRED